MGYLVDLICTRCRQSHDKLRLWNLSACCEAPLFARYDLEKASNAFSKENLPEREPTMWRYEEVLPVERVAHRISLGEGFTPLLKAGALGTRVGVPDLYVKDEGVNPTGSFKARGLSACDIQGRGIGSGCRGHPVGGECWRGNGGVTASGEGRDGSIHFHANRCSRGKRGRVPEAGCALDARGRSDYGLREDGGRSKSR